MNKRIYKKISRLVQGWTTFAGKGEWKLLLDLHRKGLIYDWYYLCKRDRSKEWSPVRKSIRS
jgi:hypothetical protein